MWEQKTKQTKNFQFKKGEQGSKRYLILKDEKVRKQEGWIGLLKVKKYGNKKNRLWIIILRHLRSLF